ncbi:GNAT family N-acetyltransferase [Motilimonas cestriensis]|uniref:GNAT family N-acetyltransferase n=1 Tax=Motilimonas cestriensis TaxID=2742685 RepID=UPI003DA2A917
MDIVQINLDDERISTVENMLSSIEGVTPQSYYNNAMRRIPSNFYLGYKQGSPACVIETYSESSSEILLMNFAIEDKSQKVGLGRKFLSMFEDHLRDCGFSSLRLTSHPDAYGFYLKNGYSKYGTGEYSLVKYL